MKTEIIETVQELSKEIYCIACGFEMAQAVATYHLTRLFGMVNEKQREAIKASLPSLVDFAMKATLEHMDYIRHGDKMGEITKRLASEA